VFHGANTDSGEQIAGGSKPGGERQRIAMINYTALELPMGGAKG